MKRLMMLFLTLAFTSSLSFASTITYFGVEVPQEIVHKCATSKNFYVCIDYELKKTQ